jgi:hypothetical protein
MRHNIFDVFTKNEEVPDVAICAMYDILKALVKEYENSSYSRIKEAFELHDAALRDQNMGGEFDDSDNPF